MAKCNQLTSLPFKGLSQVLVRSLMTPKGPSTSFFLSFLQLPCVVCCLFSNLLAPTAHKLASSPKVRRPLFRARHASAFGSQFFRGGGRRPQLFYGRLLAPFTFYRLAKFCRVPFADLTVAMKYRMQNLWKVRKNSGPILSRLWTNVHEILRWCWYRRPLTFPTHLSDCVGYIAFHSEDI